MAAYKHLPKHWSALTRAKKIGPEAVIKVVDAAFADFDIHGWPDSWHTFNIAKSDAEFEIARRRR